MRTGIIAQLLNKFEQKINPATEEKQDSIVSKLQEIANNTDELEIKADQINLNTDEIESKLDVLNQDKALASKQLPNNHDVRVSNQITGYATVAKQNEIINAIAQNGQPDIFYVNEIYENGSDTYICKDSPTASWLFIKIDSNSVFSYANENNNSSYTDYQSARTDILNLTFEPSGDVIN